MQIYPTYLKLYKFLSKINEIDIPPRPKNFKIVYHLYIVFAEDRDSLLKYCLKKGIEAKVHYPKPMYLQESLKMLKHKKGDFPETEKQSKRILSLPVNQFLKKNEIIYITNLINKFYK